MTIENNIKNSHGYCKKTMTNIIKIALCFLLLAVLFSSCGRVVNTTDELIEQNDCSSETTTQQQKAVFTAVNDATDLRIEFGKILGVKDRFAFYSIVLSDSVQAICDDAFQYCMQLEWIDISSTVTEIGANAFYKCISLHTVIIENSEIEIRSNAFEDCFSLRTVYFYGSLDEWEKISKNCNGCFDNVEIICCESMDELEICFE